MKESGRQRDLELNMESGSKTSKTSFSFMLFDFFAISSLNFSESFEVEKEVEVTEVVVNDG